MPTLAGMPTPDGLLTTREASARLGIERSTLSRWVTRGLITPAHRINGPSGIMLFDSDTVDQLAREHKPRKRARAS